ITSLHTAVKSGLGVAVLPEWLAQPDIDAGRLVRLLPKWHANELPVHVIYHGQRVLSARVRAFVELAVTYMTTELHAIH
ncbi:MAG: LysR substrate-binding domain-containing protein, partial [Roseimicrobium sp.]